MPTIEHGFKRGLGLGLLGIFLSVMVSQELISHSLVTLINIASIVAFFLALGKAKFWSYSYFAGYVLGQFVLLSSGFYSDLEIALYVILLLTMVFAKIFGVLPHY
ncbi:hypothetical protein AKJ51_04415 [candidate division MSBL1 archaeon SCGC-AAA382A20]|uniref:Uncharacterized protein n=1 Tax=candidate division MSBL1 archaeon SCGC-AAA382A20 TaxID=1698280 RepID=A0A133VHR7_9EURY|nr:hypothetical protein AKJ51_04415 [candidate division MSBL1 archaeon SCGC-AAA382A20]